MPSPPPKKSSGGSLIALIGVAAFILLGVGVTGFMEQRHLQTNGDVSSSAIIGEWRASDGAARIVFRADETLGMSAAGSSEQSALEPGVYWLTSGGMVSVKMKSGRRFTATFREFTPNQFDLVDSETQGVRVFAKVAQTAPEGR